MDGCAHGSPVVERRHVLVVHPHAAVRRQNADSRLLALVGPVQEVAGHPEVEGVGAEGIVRARKDLGRERLALGRRFAPDVLRRRPDGVGRLAHHPRGPEGGAPVEPPHAHRVGRDPPLLSRAGRKVLVHAKLGHVQDDSVARGVGEHEAGRDDDRTLGQPGVHLRIGELHLVEPRPVTLADLGEGILGQGLDPDDFADQVFPGHQQVFVRGARAG